MGLRHILVHSLSLFFFLPLRVKQNIYFKKMQQSGYWLIWISLGGFNLLRMYWRDYKRRKLPTMYKHTHSLTYQISSADGQPKSPMYLSPSGAFAVPLMCLLAAAVWVSEPRFSASNYPCLSLRLLVYLVNELPSPRTSSSCLLLNPFRDIWRYISRIWLWIMIQIVSYFYWRHTSLFHSFKTKLLHPKITIYKPS